MRNSQQTTLDLNGPILSFATQPVGVASTGVVSGTGSGIATFIGIATATFTTGVSSGSPTAPSNPASNTGIITYRWYEFGVGALSDSTYVTGTATTTLTVSRLITPTDNQRRFYLEADYIPSAYQTSSPVTAGTARSTGNAINEPLSSSVGILTVFPLIEIIAQPTSGTVVSTNQDATFTANASLTDNFFSNYPINYQWLIDGVAVSDGVQALGTEATTIVVNETISVNQTYTNSGSVSLPSSATNISLTVAGASGGSGGNDGGINNLPLFLGGSGGAGAVGRFTLPNGSKSLSFTIGKNGNSGSSVARASGGGSGGSGAATGGTGGRTGDVGWSGGGGGGGGASSVSSSGDTIIVAGGGGGGGGGSLNAPPRSFMNGYSANSWNPESSIDLFNGDNGLFTTSDGGGGGGGGGGTVAAQPGGFAGLDGEDGGYGGDNGESSWKSSSATLQSTSTNTGDGYVSLSYNYVNTETTTIPGESKNLTISGANTPTLTLKADFSTSRTVQCRITNSIASNSPVLSNLVQFTSVVPRAIINFEEILYRTNTSNNFSINLATSGPYTYTNTTSTNPTVVFYASEKDLNLELELYASKGSDNGGYRGGEGGVSIIRFTIRKNEEYVLGPLPRSGENGPVYLYRKGKLIAVVGSGGNAGTSGRGGSGGGVGIAGEAGFGRDAGVGGALIAAGNLGGDGVFGSLTSAFPTTPDTKATAPNGGRTIKCTKGVYWRDQGVSACADVGTVKFRLSDGVEVTNTASIARGYKAGYDIIQTAGRGLNSGGAGGNGATGGAGGQNGSGGGGGSGYTDGSVTVVNTRQGGNNGIAKVVIRLVS